MQEMNLLDSSNAGHPSKGVAPAGKLTHLPGVYPHTPTTQEGFNDSMLAAAPVAATATPGQIVRGVIGGVVGSTAGGVVAKSAGLGKTGQDFSEMGGGAVGAGVGAMLPEIAQTRAGKTVGVVGKAVGKLPVVDKFVKAGKTLGEIKDIWTKAPGEKTPAFPQYEKPAAAKAAPAETPKAKESAAPEDNAHPDAAEFEQKFDFPLSSYLDEAGKFDKHAFLNDIVKPRTEPPKAVMARHFGAESIPLIEKLTGEPLRMWESTAPEGAVKGGSARLAAKQAPKSVATNGSGESSASQEAINRSTSDRRVGVKYYRVDTRSGVETPIIGADALDAKAGPYDEIIRRGPDGDTTLDAGRSARRR
jgi:hypothetical protein